jgi:ubiquitin
MPKIHVHIHKTKDSPGTLSAAKAAVNEVKRHAAQLYVPNEDSIYASEEAHDDLVKLGNLVDRAKALCTKLG